MIKEAFYKQEIFYEKETSFELFTEEEWKEHGSYYGIYYDSQNNIKQPIIQDFTNKKKFSYLTPKGSQVYVDEVTKIPYGIHIKIMGKTFGGEILIN